MAISGVPLDRDRIIQAIKLKRGIITHAAEYLGIAPRTIYYAIEEDPSLKEILNKERQAYLDEKIDDDIAIVDSARKSIKALLDKNDVTATIFTLKTKDGWLEKKDAPTSDPTQCLVELCEKKHSQE